MLTHELGDGEGSQIEPADGTAAGNTRWSPPPLQS